MRIFHVLPTLSYGDAVGNDARALNAILVQRGIHSHLYAARTTPQLATTLVRNISEMPETQDDDVIIYHLSTGDETNELIAKMKGKKLIIYHNITPPEYFAPYSHAGFRLTTDGYKQTVMLTEKADFCIADSEYNKYQLVKMGCKCPIDVVPILIPFDDYKKSPSTKVLARYADTRTNIIFVGRIAPNKRQEDIVTAFDAYKKLYDPKARLFLVGSYSENDLYYQSLSEYIKRLGVKDVIFPGHIKFDEVLAYYHLADLFVSMSDHEGFGVPLVEAMCFDIPIIAKRTSAVPDTLGGSGLLLPDKDPLTAAAAMNKVMTDKTLKSQLIEGQRRRLADFSYDSIKVRFEQSFNSFLKCVGVHL